MPVDVRLLGPVEVRAGGLIVDIGHTRQRAVFAILAAEANHTVSADALEHRLWGDAPPQRARKTLHSYLTRLRGALADGGGPPIERRPGGYVLAVDADRVDLPLFRSLTARAAGAATSREKAELLDEALGLWRGEPFGDLDLPWLDGIRHRLRTERYTAELDRNDARLACGRHDGLLADLEAHLADHRLDERLAGQYMETLARSGRAADALAHYRDLRERMVEDLGHEPGTALAELHRRILAREHAEAPAAPPAPRQLPMAPASLSGRKEELAWLDRGLDGTEQSVLNVVSGPGGIGKTWLALYWAHRHAGRFPDGQLYVDLRGFDPVSAPVTAETALRGFLTGLGAEPPATLQAQSALFRSLVAGKRLLVFLDNARDAEQVVPLLPGSPGCATVVTSRHGLPGLSAAYGARQLALTHLADTDAREILVRHAGTGRVDGEPEAVAELLEYCGGLPLAVGIVAARAAVHHGFPLSGLAEELRDGASRLNALDAGELSVSVRAALDGSYRALSGRTATLFALLGLIGGADIDAYAAANLLGAPLPESRRALGELERAHLVDQFVPGRYRIHDLTRLYAVELGARDDDALRRYLDYYLHIVQRCSRLMYRFRSEHSLPEAGDALIMPRIDDEDAARARLLAEVDNVLAAQRTAAGRRWDGAWTIAGVMAHVLLTRGELTRYVEVVDLATAADVPGRTHASVRAACYAHLAKVHSVYGDSAAAAEAAENARRWAAGTDDERLLGYIADAEAYAAKAAGRLGEAIEHTLRAMEHHRASGSPVHPASMLNNIGWYHFLLGEPARARPYVLEALGIFREHPHPNGEGLTLDTLGCVEAALGRHRDAVDAFQRAIENFRETRRRNGRADAGEADAYEHLGDSRDALGDRFGAREAWRNALSRYELQARETEAARVRDKLALIASDLQ